MTRDGTAKTPCPLLTVLKSEPDVAAVAVVGCPDPLYGEEVVAVIVRRPGSTLTGSQAAAWAGQRVAKTKLPRQFVFLAELPLGGTGKVLRRQLRQQILDGALRPEPA